MATGLLVARPRSSWMASHWESRLRTSTATASSIWQSRFSDQPDPPLGGQVAVLLGVGDGTFAAPVFYDLTPYQAVRLVAVDLNHDGKLDLAVAVQHFGGFAVLLGNGDGTFQPAVTTVLGDCNDIAAADFNGDGNVDLVLASGFSVQVAFGNGDGTFQSAIGYGTNGAADTVATADMNRDGVSDLVTGGGYTAVLLGNGDGTFAAGVPITGPDARFLIATDFNGDGKPDLLVTPLLRNDVGIYTLLGNGDGAFQAAQFTGISFSDAEMNPVVADFNNDGQMDVAVTGVLSDRLAILLGKGDGTFETAIYYDTGRIPESPVAADFNGDGNPD